MHNVEQSIELLLIQALNVLTK